MGSNKRRARARGIDGGGGIRGWGDSGAGLAAAAIGLGGQAKFDRKPIECSVVISWRVHSCRHLHVHALLASLSKILQSDHIQPHRNMLSSDSVCYSLLRKGLRCKAAAHSIIQ